MLPQLKVYLVSIIIAITALIVASIAIVVLRPEKVEKNPFDIEDNSIDDSVQQNVTTNQTKKLKKVKRPKQQIVVNQNQTSNASERVEPFEEKEYYEEEEEEKEVVTNGENIEYEVDDEDIMTKSPKIPTIPKNIESKDSKIETNIKPKTTRNPANVKPKVTRRPIKQRPKVTEIPTTIKANNLNDNRKKYTTLTEDEVKNELNKMFGGIIDAPRSGADKPSVSAGDDNQKLNSECLSAHNEKRKRHGVSGLVIDISLTNEAKKRASDLKNNNRLENEPNLKYGENLYFVSPHKTFQCSKAVEVWYKEIQNYNFDDPTKSTGMVGHFTQIIWKSSQRVGCAQAYTDSTRKLYTVCLYDPPGNYKGLQKNNIPKPI